MTAMITRKDTIGINSSMTQEPEDAVDIITGCIISYHHMHSQPFINRLRRLSRLVSSPPKNIKRNQQLQTVT